MRECRVLIFPCGSEIGMELFRSLKDIRYVTLFGASSIDDHGKFLFKNYIGGLPYVTDPKFIDEINRVVDEHKIDFIFPAMDSVILELGTKRDLLHAELLTCPSEAVEICRSKSMTYKKLEGCDFLPKVYRSVEDVTTFPVLVKPAVGQGAQGVEKVKTKERLVTLMQEREEEQVICEFLPGEEYTIDCFTDRNGQLRYTSPRVRGRIRNGISVNSYTVPLSDELKSIAEEINQKMVFRGVWFFQVKRASDGRLRLLECATRVAGTMCVERARGVNLPVLTIMDALGLDVEIIPQTSEVVVDRALCNVYQTNVRYDRVYMDFDDTITVHDKLNISAITFIYQCVERGIPIYLLTRHEGNIHEDLKKYHLDESVFEAVIEVDKGKKKSEYADNLVKSIFIDDSFAERMDMYKVHHIPSFGTESIDVLIDRRQ